VSSPHPVRARFGAIDKLFRPASPCTSPPPLGQPFALRRIEHFGCCQAIKGSPTHLALCVGGAGAVRRCLVAHFFKAFPAGLAPCGKVAAVGGPTCKCHKRGQGQSAGLLGRLRACSERAVAPRVVGHSHARNGHCQKGGGRAH